ncbi:hypothetical protein O1L60_14210 [Streptomyces diastatochromogenes]|nr:hypothetical protein [Streptomyces diastatochromogenes]
MTLPVGDGFADLADALGLTRRSWPPRPVTVPCAPRPTGCGSRPCASPRCTTPC